MLGKDRDQQFPEEVPVVIELFRTQIHLEVAHHVGEDESHEHDAGHRHDIFLAKGRPVELDWEGRLALGPVGACCPPGDRCRSHRTRRYP